MPAEYENTDDEFIEEGETGNTAATVLKLRERLKKAIEEKQEYLDGWQRARADFANYKRQCEEDKKAIKALEASAAAHAFIPALDSLERARMSGKILESKDYLGIEKQIRDGFGGLGVHDISPAPGNEFNPRKHEALEEDLVDDAALDGKITRLLERGWETADQVIRPARVAVGVLKTP